MEHEEHEANTENTKRRREPVRREFAFLSQMTGEVKTLGKALLSASGWLFELWHDYREGRSTGRNCRRGCDR
jgi:hypothetical protein